MIQYTVWSLAGRHALDSTPCCCCVRAIGQQLSGSSQPSRAAQQAALPTVTSLLLWRLRITESSHKSSRAKEQRASIAALSLFAGLAFGILLPPAPRIAYCSSRTRFRARMMSRRSPPYAEAVAELPDDVRPATCTSPALLIHPDRLLRVAR